MTWQGELVYLSQTDSVPQNSYHVTGVAPTWSSFLTMYNPSRAVRPEQFIFIVLKM